jgi:hypothetical protein
MSGDGIMRFDGLVCSLQEEAAAEGPTSTIIFGGTKLSNSRSSKHLHFFIGITGLQHPSREHLKVAGILYETDGDRFIPGSKCL